MLYSFCWDFLSTLFYNHFNPVSSVGQHFSFGKDSLMYYSMLGFFLELVKLYLTSQLFANI